MAANDDVPPKLTFPEKLDLIPVLFSLIGTIMYSAVTGPFRGETGARHYKSHITHSLARQATTRTSQRQIQYASILETMYPHEYHN